MSACQFNAGPEELAALGSVFHEAWQHLAPIDGPFENPHREWLARLILGLRRSGHSGDIAGHCGHIAPVVDLPANRRWPPAML